MTILKLSKNFSITNKKEMNIFLSFLAATFCMWLVQLYFSLRTAGVGVDRLQPLESGWDDWYQSYVTLGQ